MRLKPSNRRPLENFGYEIDGKEYVGSIGKYVEHDMHWEVVDGELKYVSSYPPKIGNTSEVFFSGRTKPGSDMDSLLYDQGVTLSIAIQSGTSIEDIARSVSRTESGMSASVVGAMVDVVSNERKPFQIVS